MGTGKFGQNNKYPEFWRFQIPVWKKYEYPMLRYGTACISDDSDKAWGRLFESEAWPLPSQIRADLNVVFDQEG